MPQEATSEHLRPRGSSQGGLRQYNERVVLQALRLHGALPAAELARLTRLTAQTISLITKRLLDDGLLHGADADLEILHVCDGLCHHPLLVQAAKH